MRQSGFRAWKVFGGLAAVALLGVGCGKLPMTGGKRPEDPPQGWWGNEVRNAPPGFYEKSHYPADRGYNSAIDQVGSSIDPRTPEKSGKFGQSRAVDATGRPPPESPSQQGVGGSGRAGELNTSSDLGWRARLPYEVRPGGEFGAYGGQSPGE